MIYLITRIYKEKFVIVLQGILQYLKIITDMAIDMSKKIVLYGNKKKPANVVVGLAM